MSLALDQLPFDVLFCIASSLSLEDIVHLGQTCRQLGALLDERTVCRSVIEVSTGSSCLCYMTNFADAAEKKRPTIRIRKKLD